MKPTVKTTINEILQDLEAIENSPQGVALDLRLDLAQLVIQQLAKKGWTQKQLAQKAQIKEQLVTRIVHSSSNCTFETAGRLLFALGIKAKLTTPAANNPKIRSHKKTG